MSDSEELKRLRADLESVNGIRVRYQSDIRLEEIRNDLFDKIAKLEAAADPWRDAREAILLHMESGGNRVKEVARYARHLEDECVGQQMKIAGLQDENARLTARVAELEAGIKAEDDSDVLDAEYTLKHGGFVPFEGPIVGLEPVLDPARVLATTRKWFMETEFSIRDLETINEVIRVVGIQLNSRDAKPYPLKKGGE